MKTKHIIILTIVSIFWSLSLYAQTTTKERSVTPFKEVSSSSGIDVVYTISNNYSLKIEGELSDIDKIETSVKNSILTIKRKDGERFSRNANITTYISAPTLDRISMSGGADFTAENITNPKDIQINASGGSDIEVSKITAKKAAFNISGGADVEIKNLTADLCNINTSGGSDTEITLTATTINVNASGGSDIEIKGKAKSINVNCSGGADADIKNLTYETIKSNASGGGKIKK